MSSSQDLYTAIGLMSGTSKDGVDLACIKTDGESYVEEIGSSLIAYTNQEKLLLTFAEFAVNSENGDLAVASKNFDSLFASFVEQNAYESSLKDELESCLSGFEQTFSFEGIENALTMIHVKAVKDFLKESGLKNEDVHLVGFHGQTIFHRPPIKKTIQIGDGQLLADKTGIKTVYDFRSADVSAGGEGAPFAPVYHQAIAKRDDLAPCVVINCGGISNLTLISQDELIAFDSGPGNCLIDIFVKDHFGEECDLNGQHGSKGKFDRSILAEAAKECISGDPDYLSKPAPKSLDVRDCVMPKSITGMSPEDGCAALEALTAYFIAESINLLDDQESVPLKWVFAGGGRKNPIIRSELESQLAAKLGERVRLEDAEHVGWDGDALEGQIFAYLAVRSIKKLPLSLPGTTGVPTPITGGRLAYPS